MEVVHRPRRLRYLPQLREMVAETSLSKDKLVLPLFVKHGQNLKVPVSSMPGVFQFSVDTLPEKVEEISKKGIKSIILFGIPEAKDEKGSDACDKNGIVAQAIRRVKAVNPEMMVISDICLCEYTHHGHCGIMNQKTGKLDLDNDATLPLLAAQAVTHVEAGADMVAPSGMVDGAVGAIRQALDHHDFSHIPIMGYTAKYASTFYGPFREAAEGAPQYGDRKTYQMDYRNGEEAVREAECDLQEGADILMVKPAQSYLDVIYRLKDAFPYVPLAAYQVSGEYSMLKAAIKNEWIKEEAIVESLLSIRRAGADIIMTYFAEEMASVFS